MLSFEKCRLLLPTQSYIRNKTLTYMNKQEISKIINHSQDISLFWYFICVVFVHNTVNVILGVLTFFRTQVTPGYSAALGIDKVLKLGNICMIGCR